MPNLSRKVKQPKMMIMMKAKKSKKGKAVKAGCTVGTGRSLEDEESGDPELDIDEARMKAKHTKKAKLEAASQEQGGGKEDHPVGV